MPKNCVTVNRCASSKGAFLWELEKWCPGKDVLTIGGACTQCAYAMKPRYGQCGYSHDADIVIHIIGQVRVIVAYPATHSRHDPVVSQNVWAPRAWL